MIKVKELTVLHLYASGAMSKSCCHRNTLNLFKGLLHPKINLPACRPEPVKASFVFGAQFNVRDACGCPIDCQVVNTVEVQKRMKSIARILHQWFNLNFIKRREYF